MQLIWQNKKSSQIYMFMIGWTGSNDAGSPFLFTIKKGGNTLTVFPPFIFIGSFLSGYIYRSERKQRFPKQSE